MYIHVHVCIFMYMYIVCTYMFILVHNYMNMYIHVCTMYRAVCTDLQILVHVVRIPDALGAKRGPRLYNQSKKQSSWLCDQFLAQFRGFCKTEIDFTWNSNTTVMKCTLCSAPVGPKQGQSKQLSFYFTTVELSIIPSPLPILFLVGFRMKCRWEWSCGFMEQCPNSVSEPSCHLQVPYANIKWQWWWNFQNVT